MIIIVDSREKNPLNFTVSTEVAGLKTGDYSVKGVEDKIAIERKTINDLVGSLSTERERFQRELLRGKSLEFFALVIETTFDQLIQGKYKSKMTPQAVAQSLFAFQVRYDLHIWLASNRRHAGYIVEGLLKWAVKEKDKAVENIC